MSALDEQLAAARTAAREAAALIRPQFGLRGITHYRGHNDVQLSADVTAQQSIMEALCSRFPPYGFVSEEDDSREWPREEYVWVVDPIDGSNNFGYGIGHFSISIALVRGSRVVLALVHEPVSGREFFATLDQPLVPAVLERVPLARATVSVVTNYSRAGGQWVENATSALNRVCKRVVNLWAPSLDLALVASGSIDAVVCHEGGSLDVCGGLFLVTSSGGVVQDWKGHPLSTDPRNPAARISFVAARTQEVADRLLEVISAVPRSSGT